MNFKKFVLVLLSVAAIGCSVDAAEPEPTMAEPVAEKAQASTGVQTRTITKNALRCNAAKLAAVRAPYMRPALLSLGATEFEVQRLNEQTTALSTASCGPNPSNAAGVEREIARMYDTISARIEQQFGFAPGDGRDVFMEQIGKFNGHFARNCGVTAGITLDILMGTRPPLAGLGSCSGYDPRGNPLSASRETMQSCMANLRTALDDQNECQSTVGEEPEDDDVPTGPTEERETANGGTEIEQETEKGETTATVTIETDRNHHVIRSEGRSVDPQGNTIAWAEVTGISATVTVDTSARDAWRLDGVELALEAVVVGVGVAGLAATAPAWAPVVGAVAGIGIVGIHAYEWWRDRPGRKFCIDGSRFNPVATNASISMRSGSIVTAFNDCLCRATEAMPSVSFRNCPMCDQWMGGGRCSTESQRALVRCMNTIPEGGQIRLECAQFRPQLEQKFIDQRTCQMQQCGGDKVAVAGVSHVGVTTCSCVERGRMQPSPIRADLCRTVSCGTGSSCTCSETGCGCSRTSDLNRPPLPPPPPGGH